jgi:SAM-dependent methyltransferase
LNCDLFKGKDIDEVFEMDDVPFKEGTISAIYTEHALEHIAFDRIKKALGEWFRVLEPGGELILKIPDLEECCKRYLTAPVNSDSFFKTKHWFKCTIFGIQKSQAGEPDEAQFHRSGFSREEMTILLKDAGFILADMKSYDGWGTPSMEMKAVKPVSNLKIGWIAPDNWEAAQTRIRVLRVNQWLKAHGYRSTLLNYPEIINQGYDVCVVGKAFSEDHFKNIRMLKQHRKTIWCDLCEDIIGWPWVDEILKCCDKVICCSYTLADRVRPVNSNVEVIEDAWENQ